jgi:hypothetical protein
MSAQLKKLKGRKKQRLAAVTQDLGRPARKPVTLVPLKCRSPSPSERITYLTEHFKVHVKDHHRAAGCLMLRQAPPTADYLRPRTLDRYRRHPVAGIRK